MRGCNGALPVDNLRSASALRSVECGLDEYTSGARRDPTRGMRTAGWLTRCKVVTASNQVPSSA